MITYFKPHSFTVLHLNGKLLFLTEINCSAIETMTIVLFVDSKFNEFIYFPSNPLFGFLGLFKISS